MSQSILTIAYRIPPLLVAIVLALALVAVASSRGWRWPMLLEIALIVAFAARPSLPLLTFGLFLAALRWVPPFAAIVAQALSVPTWGGLSLPVALFALPGLHAYVRGTERHEKALPPVVVATGKTTRLEPPASLHARPLAPAEWMHACNEDPTAPHLGVVGPTRLGKTTFVLAAIGRRPGELVITTTKSASQDPWGGAEYVVRPAITITNGRGAVDFSPIADAINRVHVAMLQRSLAHDAGMPDLTLVIDEFVTTIGKLPKEAIEQVIDIWNMGAAAGVRIIAIAQEFTSSAWHVQGRRDVLNNLVFAQVVPGRLWALGRMDPNGSLLAPRSLDTAGLVALAAEAQLAGRGWVGVTPGAPAGGAGVGVGVPVVPPPSQVNGNGTNGTGTGNEAALIAALAKLRGAGITREQARSMGLAFRDENWTKAGERLGTGGNASKP